MMRMASKLREEALSGLIIVNGWLKNRFFRTCCVEVNVKSSSPLGGGRVSAR